MKKVLIIVDLQKDFCEGGSLEVNGANSIVPVINKIKQEFLKNNDIVVASREMHPYNHKSFASQNGKNPFDISDNGDVYWPDHCVTGTEGSQFHDDLDISGVEIFTKGKDIEDHPFSAFSAISDKNDVWLDDYLRDNDVTDVYVVGLATEFCVLATALDSISVGYKTIFISEASRHITEDGKNMAIDKMNSKGVEIE